MFDHETSNPLFELDLTVFANDPNLIIIIICYIIYINIILIEFKIIINLLLNLVVNIFNKYIKLFVIIIISLDIKFDL